jgi:hypothetical protein
MFAYLITYNNERYVTNADNMEEAETKFVEEFFDIEEYDEKLFQINRVDAIDSEREESCITFF